MLELMLLMTGLNDAPSSGFWIISAVQQQEEKTF